MLTVEGAAHELGIKASTVRAWLLRRKIGCVKLSARCVRIPREEVERLIRDNLIPARAEVRR
jgi:excisionase family DNA binding protein